jgi:outer membrane lipoprotein-sorting protein
MAISRRSLAFALPALFLAVFLVGCGGDGTPQEVKSLLTKAQEAAETADSYRLVLSMSFEGEEVGSMKTEELTIDFAGGDISLTDTFFDPETGEGTVIQEVVRIGDRQWARDLSSGEWVEQQPSLDEDVIASYKPRISDVLPNSESALVLAGEEEVNGVTAAHLRFELTPENVSTLLPDIPESSLGENTGGQLDVWVDAADYHIVKYELFFRDVVIQQGGDRIDVHIVLDITGINQPIEITPPV